MLIKILRQRWWFRTTTLRINRGEIDPPSKVGKEIRIDSRLRGEEELEVIIHEFTHGADWHKDEDWIIEYSEDLSRFLWRLGYRRSQ